MPKSIIRKLTFADSAGTSPYLDKEVQEAIPSGNARLYSYKNVQYVVLDGRKSGDAAQPK